MVKRALVPSGGCDVVMTPRPLAAAIIAHFNPRGIMLDPCRGEGAFYDQFPPHPYMHQKQHWCELSEGRDFLAIDKSDGWHYDWIVSNPPWSRFRAFNKRAMAISDNVVWLCTVNHFWLKARLRDMDEAGFGIKEIALVDTPPLPWPQSGFQLAAVYIKRDHSGPVTISRLAST